MSFTLFTAVHTEFNDDQWKRDCPFVVFKILDDYYYFGNNVLHCLGHDPPHEHMNNLVPTDEQHTIPKVSGVYLKEDTVLRLSENNETFKNWITNYINLCKSNNGDPTRCPD